MSTKPQKNSNRIYRQKNEEKGIMKTNITSTCMLFICNNWYGVGGGWVTQPAVRIQSFFHSPMSVLNDKNKSHVWWFTWQFFLLSNGNHMYKKKRTICLLSISISLVDNSREFPTQSSEFVQLHFLGDLWYGRVSKGYVAGMKLREIMIMKW